MGWWRQWDGIGCGGDVGVNCGIGSDGGDDSNDTDDSDSGGGGSGGSDGAVTVAGEGKNQYVFQFLGRLLLYWRQSRPAYKILQLYSISLSPLRCFPKQTKVERLPCIIDQQLLLAVYRYLALFNVMRRLITF